MVISPLQCSFFAGPVLVGVGPGVAQLNPTVAGLSGSANPPGGIRNPRCTPRAWGPKAQQRRDAKQIDEQYERATKGSSWATTPKPLSDPWQSVKPKPTDEKK